MILNSTQEMIYRGTENRIAKSGNTYTIVHLGDPVNYQSFEFFLTDDLDLTGLSINDKVYPVVQLMRNGYNINTNLLALNKENKK